jgi:hypothetical protein
MKSTIRKWMGEGIYSNLSALPPEKRIIRSETLIKWSQYQWGEKVLQAYYQYHPVDAYMISFPKCGRTWLRLMIGKAFERYFQLEDQEILNKILKLEPLYELHPAVPRVRVSHDDNPQWKKPFELETKKDKYKDTKVILLVRDPRDVVVSAYFEQKKRVALWEEATRNPQFPDRELIAERLKPYEGTITEFLNGEVGSLETILRFYNIWAENREVPKSLHLVRYEDLHQDTVTELTKVLEFLEVSPVPVEILKEAVEYTSFKNMHKMEADDAFKSTNLRPADKTDETTYKTRKGKVGGYVEYFNNDQIAYMNQQINEKLSPFFGYRP